MRLGAQQQHTVTLVLSADDGPWRAAESGLLQQVLLLLAAVRDGSPAALQLRRTEGLAMARVEGTARVEGGADGPQGAWLVFVATRRATACLVRSVRDVASCLDVEAKPFVSAGLRGLFGTRPSRAFSVQSECPSAGWVSG